MRNLTLSTASFALLLGLGAAALAPPSASVAQIGIGVSVGFGPPALPIYDQPPIPGYGFLWTPGFWAWDNGFGDYYWVPGAWVRPPRVGLLWTPGYWGWNSGAYSFNQGYWGSNVGFYGGINYGFGYSGEGYGGGYWQGNRLYYNRAVDNLGRTRFNTVYSRPMADRRGVGSASYAGGPGGVQARATAAQLAVQHEKHIAATATQVRQVSVARTITANRAGVNHGKPAIAATRTAGVMRGSGAVPAKAAAVYNRPANAPTPSARATHAKPAAAVSHAPASTHAAHARTAPAGNAHPSSHAPSQHMSSQHSAPQRAAPQRMPSEHAPPPRVVSHAPPMGAGGGESYGHGPAAAPRQERAPGPQGRPGNGDRREPPHP
jgi:hypothetical protein